MKISKTALLISWWVFTILSLWLMFVDAINDRIILKTDAGNAIQHMGNLDIVRTWDGITNTKSFVTVSGQSGSVFINLNQNYNFILSNTWEKLNKIYWSKTQRNSILWWIKNVITGWNDSVILWWSDNLLSGDSSTVLWWNDNILTGNYSVILWWKDNEITWSWSSVVWGKSNEIEWNYSVIVWNSSVVAGDYSVALWNESKVSANNSFLWTDSFHADVLNASNVFAVVSKNWMVINAEEAHNSAQLTIWWPMIVIHKWNEENIRCDDSSDWWVMKVMNNTGAGTICLCSCDGDSRNSMFGKWNCSSLCDDSIIPDCGTEVKKFYKSGNYYYSWSCKVWEVLEWTWSYFVDRDNVVYWTCQTEDGAAIQCDNKASGTVDCIYEDGRACPDETPETFSCQWSYPSGVTRSTVAPNNNTTNWFCATDLTKACSFTCPSGQVCDWTNKCKAETFSCQWSYPSGVTRSTVAPNNNTTNWFCATDLTKACSFTCPSGMQCNSDNTWCEKKPNASCSSCPGKASVPDGGICESYAKSSACPCSKIISKCNNGNWDKYPWKYSSCTSNCWGGGGDMRCECNEDASCRVYPSWSIGYWCTNIMGDADYNYCQLNYQGSLIAGTVKKCPRNQNPGGHAPASSCHLEAYDECGGSMQCQWGCEKSQEGEKFGLKTCEKQNGGLEEPWESYCLCVCD